MVQDTPAAGLLDTDQAVLDCNVSKVGQGSGKYGAERWPDPGAVDYTDACTGLLAVPVGLGLPVDIQLWLDGKEMTLVPVGMVGLWLPAAQSLHWELAGDNALDLVQDWPSEVQVPVLYYLLQRDWNLEVVEYQLL